MASHVQFDRGNTLRAKQLIIHSLFPSPTYLSCNAPQTHAINLMRQRFARQEVQLDKGPHLLGTTQLSYCLVAGINLSPKQVASLFKCKPREADCSKRRIIGL